MRSTRRSIGVTTFVLAGALAGVTAVATAANAQQLVAPRLARNAATPPATVVESRAEAAALARDSVVHYLHEARVQRRDGSSLLVAGLATMTVAWVQYARSSSGTMGMNGGEGAAFATGAALSLFGGTRLALARDDFASAERWHEAQLAAKR